MNRRCHLILALAASSALSVVAACFGDNEVGGPLLQEVIAPQAVDADGGIASIVVRVRARPQEEVAVSLTATLGVHTPERAVVTTDAAGLAEATFTYTAGPTPGTEDSLAQVTDPLGAVSSRDFSFAVTPITRVGQSQQLTGFAAVDLGFFEGQAVPVASAGSLRRVGLFAPGPAEILIGVYSEVAGLPSALVVQTTGMLQRGRNELAVPATTLAAGSYWIMASYKGAANMYVGTTVVPTRYIARPFATTAPAVYPSHTLYNDEVRNLYLVFGE
ncbi:MAG: hypothetical protein IPI49_26595 [Myxococcales bacterium]|nr:hypothetical protein [Myxococcales bacterium]